MQRVPRMQHTETKLQKLEKEGQWLWQPLSFAGTVSTNWASFVSLTISGGYGCAHIHTYSPTLNKYKYGKQEDKQKEYSLDVKKQNNNNTEKQSLVRGWWDCKWMH